MDNTQIVEVVESGTSGIESLDINLVDVAAVAFILFAIGALIGLIVFQYPVRVAGYDRFSSAAAFSHLWREQTLLQPPLRTGSTVQQAGDRP